MELTRRMPFSELLSSAEVPQEGWIYVQPNSSTFAVEIDSPCVVVETSGLSREDRAAFRSGMKGEGFIAAVEALDFFNFSKAQQGEADSADAAKMAEALTHYIQNDSWPE